MTPAPARLGLLFALTLALPAVFAGAWAWLVPGGVVERARRDEQRTAEQALAAAERAFADELQRAAAASAVLLELDADRRVVGPFARPAELATGAAATAPRVAADRATGAAATASVPSDRATSAPATASAPSDRATSAPATASAPSDRATSAPATASVPSDRATSAAATAADPSDRATGSTATASVPGDRATGAAMATHDTSALATGTAATVHVAGDRAERTEIALAEQAAGDRLARGDIDAAAAFFAHAAADGSLSPEGWLDYARARAASDPAAARALLADARSRHADARCAGLPFALLLELTAAALAPERADVDALLHAAARVAAEALAPVADELAARVPALRDDARLVRLRVGAAAALAHRDRAAPTAPARGPDDSVLMPLGDDRLAALPAADVARARSAAFAVAAREHPTVTVHVAAPAEAAADGPALANAATGATWRARPAALPASVVLALAAHASLALAVLTLVLGNLLLWRLTRRELALVRLRADFVDLVSHELRTPLTALSLQAEMLAAGDVPPARTAHYLRALHGSVRRLGDQVERILDFGRLEKGAPLRRERLPARALLARGLRAGLPALRLVAQQLTVDAPRALPAVVGDVEVLSRALRNLLENAAKYAPPGSTVAVRAFAERGEVVIEVADRGPGVPADERSAVFQPFVRGRDAASGTPGSGLGLALVAAAARLHDGRIEVHERPGGGALFSLRLPASREERAS